MSWLRVDDGFTAHPKFDGWRPAERWALLELLVYCARFRTQGRVPNDLSLLPKSVTKSLVLKAVDSGWLDDVEGELWIHDWKVYNPPDPTAAARMRRYRDRNADRNAVDESSPQHDDDDRNNDRNGNGSSRAGSRARPVPSPKERSVSQSVVKDPERASDVGTDGLTALGSTFTNTLDELRRSEDDDA